MVVAKAANQFETEQDSERKPKRREPAIVEAVGGEASEDEIEMRGGILMKFLDSFFIGTILKISSKRRKQMRNGQCSNIGEQFANMDFILFSPSSFFNLLPIVQFHFLSIFHTFPHPLAVSFAFQVPRMCDVLCSFPFLINPPSIYSAQSFSHSP
jgi:hypothetical protein